jgi:hypothetical protein
MKDKWTEFIITQTMDMSGLCVAHIVDTVGTILGADVVLVMGVDGAGVADLPINRLTPIREFIGACSVVTQYDWADIYLLKTSRNIAFDDAFRLSDYPRAIEQTLATIRVVDTSYFFVYVRSNDSLALQGRFDLLAEPAEGSLTEFVFPM